MGTDSLYYIMDYSGNYYRTNQADQLVTAAGAQEAQIFTFAQANRRIGAGKKAAFYCMIPMENETEQEEKHDQAAEQEQSVSPVKELTYDEVEEQVEKNVFSYDLSEMDWAEYLTHFTYIVAGIGKYRDEINRKLSDIDKKICDVLHYIELCETDDQEAVDLVELLRVCRENRREIKDELTRVEYFQINLGTSANAGKARQALKSIQGLDTRKYKPRKFDELFKNCTLKDRRLQKEDLSVTETKNVIKKHHYINEGGEETMTETRNYTPFDGKQNDWISFARQQAEFYRNAEQYITNIQFDIDEIDDEIEAILLQTEDANYNVAQGYKVFKRLKELRIERKEKEKELDCLYALTDTIDCPSLAGVCEESLAEIEDIMDVQPGNDSTDIFEVDTEQEEIHVVKNINEMAG